MLARRYTLAVILASNVLVLLLTSCSNEKLTDETTVSTTAESEEAQQTTLTPPDDNTDHLGLSSDSTEAPTKPGIVKVDPYIPEGPNGFIPLWQCIAPAFRPRVPDPDALRNLEPESYHLTEGLLDMVFMRQPPCVKNLLDGGADVNAFRTPADGFDDDPALHLALNQSNWDLAKYLLNRSADPNIKTPYEGHTGKGGGYTALDMAYGSFAPQDIIAELKKRGAKTARY